jgi:hypothetical protein
MRLRRSTFLLAALPAFAAPVEFNREIRPILSDRCYTCHGPDSVNRKANLRLDVEEIARPKLAAALERVTSTNKALRMPPVYAGAGLTEPQIATLKQWVAEGAPWQKHWSFIPPVRPEPPTVKNAAWPKNDIDRFLLARLEREGMQPSPTADRTTLIRRVTLDLTGIAPAPSEVDAFLADSSPRAYETVVDRLLASPRYGERMAARWLDAARYADTNGYQTDAERFMWRWRDWVIGAFNRNMRFDQFTIEQLAGDLLPNPTLDQLIATGFNRNHRGNGEGGSIPEEFLVEYHADRVETTSTVWMGLTIGCSRCHDHKYDPFTQKEFYQLTAFFNNLDEKGKVFKYGNSPPMIPAPTSAQQQELAKRDAAVTAAKAAFQATSVTRAQGQAAWEKTLTPGDDWHPSRFLLENVSLKDAKSVDGAAEFAQGRYGQAVVLDGKRYLEAGNIGNFGFQSKFTVAAWFKTESPDGILVSRAEDREEQPGWGIHLKDGKLQVNLIQRWLDDCLRVETEQPVPLHQWAHVAVTYDASRVAAGIKVYLNGEPVKLRVIVDDLNQTFTTKEPFRIGAGHGMRFHGAIEDVRLYGHTLSAREAAVLANNQALDAIARIPAAARTQAQRDKLEWAYLDKNPEWNALLAAEHERAQFLDALPTVMVMREMAKPRETFLLVRGAYDRPGDRVYRAVPASLPPLPRDAPADRLGFARWLVNGQHPLTARVTVNRFWQMMFGTGIVKTVEDFGSQGEWPVHPELLDWLATEFVRRDWDVKAMLKEMVMSAAYQQNSRATPELLQRDPDNRLLARGPRLRLPAEMVRDQALAMSGLLVENLGGPSVKPYQPAGLWKELAGGTDYQRDHGTALYRRSLYTYWKRAVPPPGMMTFDSAGREACTVRESRTNTPLQALTLMNDETYLEAARKMAERMMLEGGATPASRLDYGFKLALARAPHDRERTVLLASLHHYLDRYKTDAAAAQKLLTQGESPVSPGLDKSELAAYSTVASMLLNLDETVTKE